MFHVKHLGGLPPPQPVGAVRLRLVGPAHWADLRGPMICTLVDAPRRREIVATLGPDPLRRGQRPEAGWERVHRSRRTVAELLMDQSVIAGVGNVYRCEVLHRLAVDPLTRGVDLSEQVWREIWDDLVLLMPLGRTFSQIITHARPGEDAARVEAYGPGDERSPAGSPASGSATRSSGGSSFTSVRASRVRRCSNPLQEKEIAGRRLYWCPACQVRR